MFQHIIVDVICISISLISTLYYILTYFNIVI